MCGSEKSIVEALPSLVRVYFKGFCVSFVIIDTELFADDPVPRSLIWKPAGAGFGSGQRGPVPKGVETATNETQRRIVRRSGVRNSTRQSNALRSSGLKPRMPSRTSAGIGHVVSGRGGSESSVAHALPRSGMRQDSAA